MGDLHSAFEPCEFGLCAEGVAEEVVSRIHPGGDAAQRVVPEGLKQTTAPAAARRRGDRAPTLKRSRACHSGVEKCRPGMGGGGDPVPTVRSTPDQAQADQAQAVSPRSCGITTRGSPRALC